MKTKVRLFAVARQLAGAEVAEVELPSGATIEDLRAALAGQYPALAPLVSQMMFAISNEYAGNRQAIPPNVEIACIPPVSGG